MLKTWEDFRKEINKRYINPRRVTNKQTAEGVNYSLTHFEELCRPKTLASIDAAMFKDFIEKRLAGVGDRRPVMNSTIGKDLDHLKLAFNAVGLEDLAETVPRLKDEKRSARPPTADDFTAIIKACAGVYLPQPPKGANAGDWWVALLTTAVSTGWFIRELLKLKWSDVQLDVGVVRLAPEAAEKRRTKGETVRLAPVAIDHLKRLRDVWGPHIAAQEVFAWHGGGRDLRAMWLNNKRWALWSEFKNIQRAANVKLQCDRKHRHTKTCDYYSFDDFQAAAALHSTAEMLHHAQGVYEAAVVESRKAKTARRTRTPEEIEAARPF